MRGDAFSAGVVAGREHSVPVSPPDRRIGIRVHLEVDGDSWIGRRCVEKSNLKRVTVDTAVQEKVMTGPTNAKLLNPGSRVSDEVSSINCFDASPKLCSSRPKSTFEGEPLYARSSDKADERGGKEIAHDLRQGGTRCRVQGRQNANPCVQYLTETLSGLGADQTRNETGMYQQEQGV